MVQDSGHSKSTPPVGTDRGQPWPSDASSEGTGSLGFGRTHRRTLFLLVLLLPPPECSLDSSQDHGRLNGTMRRFLGDWGSVQPPDRRGQRCSAWLRAVSLQRGLRARGAALTHHCQRPHPRHPPLEFPTKKCCPDPPGPAEDGRVGAGPALLAELGQETPSLGCSQRVGAALGSLCLWVGTQAA